MNPAAERILILCCAVLFVVFATHADAASPFPPPKPAPKPLVLHFPVDCDLIIVTDATGQQHLGCRGDKSMPKKGK